MALTVNKKTLIKVGRYSKEFIDVTFTDGATTLVPIDTRLNKVLYGVTHLNFDQANVAKILVSIIPSSSNTVNVRGNADVNGVSGTIELTGY